MLMFSFRFSQKNKDRVGSLIWKMVWTQTTVRIIYLFDIIWQGLYLVTDVLKSTTKVIRLQSQMQEDVKDGYQNVSRL